MGEEMLERAPLSKTATSLAPLAVDLDGTLLKVDTLFESLVANLFRRPFATLGACFAIFRGRAALKHRLADVGLPDIETLPVNDRLADFLKLEKARGRRLHLATAADERIARAVADRLGVFQSVAGTKGGANLMGAAKRADLEKRFPQGFAYAGDSRADLEVWKGAAGAVLVGAGAGLAKELARIGVRVEAEIPREKRFSFTVWRKAFRIHQWSKNILLLAPLFLAHKYIDPQAVVASLVGFLILGVVASATYIVNDLADLSADRRHRTKSERPFASGAIPVQYGLLAAPALIAGGLAASYALSPAFAGTLLAYLGTTLAYSFGLKRVPLVDVFMLGALYALRVLMGVALIDVGLSPWLIAFSVFFFYSLSLAKRHTEVIAAADRPPNDELPGRGYRPSDWPVTLAAGAASAAASIIIIVLYLTEEAFPSGVYRSPEWLWATPAIMTIWTQRIWLLAHRGELDDDPVAFAVKDRGSLLLGAALVIFFTAATIL